MKRFEIKWDERAGPILFIKLGRRKIGLAFCHRLENRSFKVFGHTMPMCARCAGQILGLVLFLFLFHFKIAFPPILGFVLFLPLLLDGFSQLFGFRKSNNVLRLFTGILFTLGFLSIVSEFL